MVKIVDKYHNEVKYEDTIRRSRSGTTVYVPKIIVDTLELENKETVHITIKKLKR